MHLHICPSDWYTFGNKYLLPQLTIMNNKDVKTCQLTEKQTNKSLVYCIHDVDDCVFLMELCWSPEQCKYINIIKLQLTK